MESVNAEPYAAASVKNKEESEVRNNKNNDSELKELMVIEISLTNGHKEDVIVNFGDKPEDLAVVREYVLLSCC